MITITVMLAAVIEVLDTTIINVSLNNIGGSVGADSDQVTWILTAYIVAAGVFMPLTGYLVNRFGQKKVLLANIIGFMIFSMLCGTSTSLTEIVIFRIFQGVFGASLVPMSQYILRSVYPTESLPKAMAIWGIGIMFAPVVGPTLGGYITEYASWRWLFYINVPVCIIATVMAINFVPDTLKKDVKTDWIGLFILIIGVGSLQLLLDQGNSHNWLSSGFIISMLYVSALSIIIFIVRGLFLGNRNILNLYIFKDRNFTFATLCLMFFSGSMFGIMVLQPIVMEYNLGYTALNSGIVMLPRGLASIITIILSPILMKRIDARIIIIAGLFLCAYGTYLFSQISPQVDSWGLVYPGIIQGLGMGFFFIPSSSISLQTLPPESIAEGSGLYSFSRSIGTSMGISILATMQSRLTQSNWSYLGENLSYHNQNVIHWMSSNGYGLLDKSGIYALQQLLYSQSFMVSFINCSYVATILLVICIPFIIFLKKNG